MEHGSINSQPTYIYRRYKTPGQLARDKRRQEEYGQRQSANNMNNDQPPSSGHIKPAQSARLQTQTVCTQTSETKQSTPPRSATPKSQRSTTPSSSVPAKSNPAELQKDISPPRKDSVHVNRQANVRKDSLRSSKQRCKVKFIGKPCNFVRSCDTRNNKLVLDICSKCTDNCIGVLRGLKSNKGGGMRLSTSHGTNFVWTCYRCREEDKCSALDIQSDNLYSSC